MSLYHLLDTSHYSRLELVLGILFSIVVIAAVMYVFIKAMGADND